VLGCGWTFAAYLPAFHVPLAMFGDPGPVCIFMKLPASAGFEALEDVDDPFFGPSGQSRRLKLADL
jgi:hypothetical protein